jgi:hypothetical protein
MAATRHVIGWKLDRAEREALLRVLPASYPDVVADHVTLAAGVAPDEPLPPAAEAEIIGRADDGAGVEAMVVRIAGTAERPGGGTYHITWSLDRKKGREARESNDVIAARGWEPIGATHGARLIPARLK